MSSVETILLTVDKTEFFGFSRNIGVESGIRISG